MPQLRSEQEILNAVYDETNVLLNVGGSSMDTSDVTITGALPAGTALVGKVGIDQVTANANEVVVKSGDITETNSGTIAGDTTSIDGKITACNTGAVVLAAGTASIGKLATNSGVDIGDVDVTSLPEATIDANAFQATFTSADATSASSVKAKTADKKMYITSIVISVDTAMSVQLQDDNTPTVLMEQIYLAANGGAVINFPKETPLVVGTNYDLDVITSAAGNISITVTGYLKA